ncbi:MTG2 (predicted) [Pycnogonum litorale]
MRLSFFPIGIIIRQFSAKPLRSKKNRSLTEYAKKFVDFKKVDCRAGSGGSGMLAFLRIFCNPKAGPSGGDGGNGGHVIFRASTNINSLEEVPSIVKGENGESGQSKDCHGASAKHTYVDVPVGSVFRNQDDVVVADLSFNGAWFVAVHGGAGGKGNHFFLTNENRHPRIAEVGGVGEVKKYNVELRVLAHAGLVNNTKP